MSLVVRRKFMYVSVFLCVVGVVLVLGALLTEAYTIKEPFRVDKSKIQVSDSFILRPNSNRTYLRDSIGTNSSIFQISINNTEAVIFKIVQYERTVVFERRVGGGSDLELNYFWTPPFPSLWLFALDNPYSTPTNVSIRVTQYCLKGIEYRDVTHYHPLLDPYYGYIGLAAITIATVINLTPTILESWQEYQKQLEKETIKRHQSNAR